MRNIHLNDTSILIMEDTQSMKNIYRDWFNKYGKMRRPKVDVLSLVKDIQWKQYVRWSSTAKIKNPHK